MTCSRRKSLPDFLCCPCEAALALPLMQQCQEGGAGEEKREADLAEVLLKSALLIGQA